MHNDVTPDALILINLKRLSKAPIPVTLNDIE